MGWRGLLIEPILPLCQKAAAARPRSRVIHAALSRPGREGSARFTITQNVPVLSFLDADADHVARCHREGAVPVQVDVPVTTLNHVLRSERRRPAAFGSPWVPKNGWRIDLVSIDVEGGELDVLAGFDLARFRPRVLLIENDRPSGAGLEGYLVERGYRKFHRQVINDFYALADGSTDDLQLSGLVPVSRTAPSVGLSAEEALSQDGKSTSPR